MGEAAALITAAGAAANLATELTAVKTLVGTTGLLGTLAVRPVNGTAADYVNDIAFAAAGAAGSVLTAATGTGAVALPIVESVTGGLGSVTAVLPGETNPGDAGGAASPSRTWWAA